MWFFVDIDVRVGDCLKSGLDGDRSKPLHRTHLTHVADTDAQELFEGGPLLLSDLCESHAG